MTRTPWRARTSSTPLPESRPERPSGSRLVAIEPVNRVADPGTRSSVTGSTSSSTFSAGLRAATSTVTRETPGSEPNVSRRKQDVADR